MIQVNQDFLYINLNDIGIKSEKRIISRKTFYTLQVVYLFPQFLTLIFI